MESNEAFYYQEKGRHSRNTIFIEFLTLVIIPILSFKRADVRTDVVLLLLNVLQMLL